MKNAVNINPCEHKIYFRLKGCKSLDTCKALCCRKWDINLAFEEYSRGGYEAEPFCSNDKTLCPRPGNPCPQRSFRLKKNKDGSCVYLNEENRCAIYFRRPIVCRNFSCDEGFNIEPVCYGADNPEDDSEICSFEGGLPLGTKYLVNPYLEVKKVSKEKNRMIMVFKDITSCKDKTVKLIGFDYPSDKKEFSYFLKQFNGKNTLKAILKNKKVSEFLSKDAFLNLALYLIDENVLIGIF